MLYLAFADGFGTLSPKPYAPKEEFLFERLGIYEEYMARPYVGGKDLIKAGLVPDAKFSAYLEYAHKLRLAGIEKNSALKQTLAFARNIRIDLRGRSFFIWCAAFCRSFNLCLLFGCVIMMKNTQK